MFLVIMKKNDYHYLFKDRKVGNIVKNMKRLLVENMKKLSYCFRFSFKLILSFNLMFMQTQHLVNLKLLFPQN